MRYGLTANHAARAAVILSLSLGAAVFGAVPPAYAQEVKGSHIEVMVCPRGAQSGLTIQAPQSDSIVTSPATRVSGSVHSISQIDFYIDDVYNNTLAVGLGETTFASDVALSPGTHTIRLTAIDSCAQESHQDSVVVTYHPQFQAGAGKDTDTVVPGNAASPGAAVSAALPGSAAESQSAAGPAGPEAAANPAIPPVIRQILNSLDIGPAAPEDAGVPEKAKASSAIIGLLLLAGVPILVHTTAAVALLGRWETMLGKRQAARGLMLVLQHPQLILMGLGAILLVLPFVT